MDVVQELLSEPQVLAYFAALGWSIQYCFRHTRHWWQIAAAIGSMALTWWYICKFTYEWKQAGRDYVFDAAYLDVVRPPHWGPTSQLLTWVVVAVIWNHESSVWYLIFGMLGAMSAAFVTWVPNDSLQSGRRIPVCYVATSLLSLLSIAMLPKTLNFAWEFGLWLKALHVLLAAPKVLSMLWPKQPTVDSCGLYFALFSAIALGGLVGVPPNAWAWPVTDCQFSITCDLLLCAGITLYAIWRRTGSAVVVSIFALLMSIISPGAALALYLLVGHAVDAHGAFITWLQQRVANSLRAPAAVGDGTAKGLTWVNLGLWDEATEDYNTACENLAMCLGSAVLEDGDAVLACGCGYGSELHLFRRRFQLEHITGIDSNAEAVRQFEAQDNMRCLPISVSDMVTRLPPRMFNKIVALDNVYHYPDKARFFHDCATMLPPGGQVGVTDIMLRDPSPPLWLLVALRAANIPVGNLWPHAAYTERLTEAGFLDVRIESLGASVIGRWVPAAALAYLDYVVVVASTPGAQRPRPPRRRIAIVGSGLSGLAAAHRLSKSASHDVTLFESKPKVGLGGNIFSLPSGGKIDIPLRLIGQGYYGNLLRLVRSLSVPVVQARVDCCFYGDDGPGGDTKFVYHSQVTATSCLQTALNWPVSCIRDALHSGRSLHGGGANESASEESWASWLERHGYEQRGEKSLAMWLLMGQLSWVLSCTYEQITGYPARIILGFIRSLGLGAEAMLSNTHDASTICRIEPCSEALQTALLYGSRVRCNTSVAKIDKDLVVAGESFDAVVVATEATAVKHVVRDASPVFDRIKYQPSRIVLHSDPALMPPRRCDWKALNVRRAKGQEMCELTVWLNVYYPKLLFPSEIFQTWNPHRQPASILQEVHFNRAVHSEASPAIQKEIAELQGKGGVYYAGAYCMEGMGLLEQALLSGERAAELILEQEQEESAEKN